MDQDTICAISTAPGVGGIAVIRISGPDAIALGDQCFSPNGKAKKISEMKAYTMGFGRIIEQDKILDEVVAGVFRAPHSYTGEDIVEITCHGSTYIQQRILELLLQKGCRMAHPGEYTQRAFLNGKMDLSQAEAVADVIASSSAGQHKLAISQMRGGFSKKLTELRKQLLHFTSLIELELDFGEEDVSFANRDELLALAEHLQTYITKLADSFKIGNAVKNGIPVAIVGETNAGKSTLLNYLVGEERAIVSDIHGTTRDVIEDTINIGGIIYRFIDTAGIRQTTDTIENMGIERTYAKINQAR
ncbi:MAG: tRNA uridine-5-carboxymethylaminomethyl(34) synthesis GTPase MnmE, partial [Massilibacteroides sp.]|nr:tRNA uridine-5-carboxymethylaminomethyl(34) synthesis GTPase MnmE [Massilibacteroides sp.]